MSVLRHTPVFTTADAAGIAGALYGIRGNVDVLAGERDQNFLLRTADGERFVLKIANSQEEVGLLEAQNAALQHLSRSVDICPSVCRTRDGRALALTPRRWGAEHLVRLLTWIPGVPLAAAKWKSSLLLENFGRAMAAVDASLATFDHPAAHREFHWDLASGFTVIRERLPLVSDQAQCELIAHLTDGIEQRDTGRFARLRRSVVHNDPNDHNVLIGPDDADPFVRRQQVVGLLDFGDIVWSYAVADLAIAIAYAILGRRDIIRAAASVISGYHAVRPLQDDDVDSLFGLVVLRLCTSIVMAAEQQTVRPDDPYLTISQRPIRELLPRLAAIAPRFATAAFRDACGWPPLTRQVRPLSAAAPLVAADPWSAVVLDLSVGSSLVSAVPEQRGEAALLERIRALMGTAELAVGRYGDGILQAADDAEVGRRNLTTDLFATAGTEIRAPFNGILASAANSAVVLKHVDAAGEPFYTVLRNVRPLMVTGDRVSAGERVASFAGEQSALSRMRVQVVLDRLDPECGFPQSAPAHEWRTWSALSPDPAGVLGLPTRRLPRDDVIARRRARIGSNVRVGYRIPVRAERGWMQYLYDEDGRRYLDAYNNVPHVGHCHPRVVAAAASQMHVLNTNTRYLQDVLVEYAERLCATLPEPLRICYFVNSGSEANELALRLARAYAKQDGIIVLDHAYHGNTTTLVSISPYKFNGPGGEGAPEWVRVAPLPDVYRGPYRRDALTGTVTAGRRYAEPVGDAARSLRASSYGLAAFIAESAPSVAGQIVLPDGYLRAVYEIVRHSGGVCIADEVQTAYGRTGDAFYAFQPQGVVPDIVALGKPIGNGYPIGAVVTTPAIARSFDNGMEFFSTFGGSTVSCAVGLAVLDVVEDEHLMDHARDVGDLLLGRLRDLAERYTIIGDVRGRGLFLGVELVKDRDTLEPAGAEAEFVINRMREEGVLIGTEGPHGNVLKIRPPMPFAAADAETLRRVLDSVLSELE